MNTQTDVPPVRRTVIVKQPPDRAFALFTGRIDDWWPRVGAMTGGSRGGSVVLEPRPHGRVYRRTEDGSVDFWGEVRVWEPPRRLVLAWQPVPGAAEATEVEVRFSPEGGGTRLELEHRGWAQLGAQAVATRAEYESGWGDALTSYTAATRDNGPAIASLILGITGIVLPILGILAAPFAIAFGVAGRRRARAGAPQGTLATVGLTLGAIGLVLWAMVLVLGAGLVLQSFDGGDESSVPVESVQTHS